MLHTIISYLTLLAVNSFVHSLIALLCLIMFCAFIIVFVHKCRLCQYWDVEGVRQIGVDWTNEIETWPSSLSHQARLYRWKN